VSISLNSSRSNIYRLIYPNTVTHEQATAILAALEKHGPADEAQLKQLLQQQILPSVGVPPCATTVKSSKSNTSD
jgi:hypothetical protein